MDAIYQQTDRCATQCKDKNRHLFSWHSVMQTRTMSVGRLLLLMLVLHKHSVRRGSASCPAANHSLVHAVTLAALTTTWPSYPHHSSWRLHKLIASESSDSPRAHAVRSSLATLASCCLIPASHACSTHEGTSPVSFALAIVRVRFGAAAGQSGGASGLVWSGPT